MRKLRRSGATAVLGAHPHVLQPIVVDGGDSAGSGPGLVAYSMGNFIWDPRGGPTADTGLLEMHFVGSRLVGHRRGGA